MAEEKYFQVQFQPVGKRVKVLQGTTVLEAARQAGIELTTACGGNGSCGQCQVVLVEGCLSPVKPNEKFLITEEDLQRGYRLACGAQILSDVRLQVESSLKTFPPDPFIDAVDVQLEPAALQDLRSDLTRLRDALHAQGVKDEVTASSALVRSLPDTLRENDWKVTAYLRRGEIL